MEYIFHFQSSFLMEQITDLGGLYWDVYVYVRIQMYNIEQAGEVSIQYMACTLVSRKWVTLCFKMFESVFFFEEKDFFWDVKTKEDSIYILIIKQ